MVFIILTLNGFLTYKHQKELTFIIFILSLFKGFYWNGIAKNCSHPHVSANRKLLHTIEEAKEQLKVAGIIKTFKPDWEYFKCKNSNCI